MSRRGVGSLLVGLTFLAVVSPLAAQTTHARVRTEALHTYIHGITAEIAQDRIGADGVPALIELLADPTFPRRDNVVAFLGWLGDDEAAGALLRHLDAPPAPLTVPDEDRALLLAPQSLGQIAGRGNRRALEALLAMTAPGSNGASLARAASRAPIPAALRDDLLTMALRGLAYARDARAEARLRAVQSGVVRPVAGGRDLRGAAADAIGLSTRLGGSGDVAASPRPRLDGASLAASPAAGAVDRGASGLRVPANVAAHRDADLRSTVFDASFDSAHETVRQSLLTYANHPKVTSPMTNARLDQILADASVHLGKADFQGDVACCKGLVRSGDAQTFGSMNDGLDIVDNATEMNAVLDHNVARVKVVRAINYCGGTGTNIIGCGWINGEGVALVRYGGITDEGMLWAHEYGHNVGLPHIADSRYVMYFCLCGTSFGLTQTECNRFYSPFAAAHASLVTAGACTDADADEVQDQIDNCPGAPNNAQQDTNGDGVGDVCEEGIVLDIDGNGSADALSDGLYVVRWLFELGGVSLVGPAAGPGCKRCDAEAIEIYLDSIADRLDIDGDGKLLPLSDGVLVLRWLFGVRGDALVNGAVTPGDCDRCSAVDIEPYLAGLS